MSSLFHRSIWRTVGVYLVYVAVVLGAGAAIYWEYREQRDLRILVLEEHSSEAILQFNALLEVTLDEVKAAALTADDFYRFHHHTSGAREMVFTSALRPSEHFEGFVLDVPVLPLDKDRIGNLFGLGDLNLLGDSHVLELEMAFSLNSHFRSAMDAIPNLAGISYTSLRQFQYRLPSLPAGQARWAANTHERDAFALGLPSSNPDREPFWTQVHVAAGDGGALVTTGLPVYEEDAFRGTIALDLTLAGFSDYLGSHRIDLATNIISNDQGQIIAHDDDAGASKARVRALADAVPGNLRLHLEAIRALPSAALHEVGGYLVWRQPVAGAPWHYLILVDSRDLMETTLTGMVPEGLVLLLLLVTLVAIERIRITSRRLRVTTVELQVSMDNMPGGMIMLDDQLRYVVHNDKYRALLGLPPELIHPGVSIEDGVRYQVDRGDYGPGEKEAQVEAVLSRYREREAIGYDHQLAEDRFLDIRLAPMDEGGVVSVATDITERKRAERRLQDAYSTITDSVNYASRIQQSMLPGEELLSEVLRDWFVIWEPRDVVGGDFYWLHPCTGGHVVIVADCTGHGVPGAFMTIVGTGALNQALQDHPDGDPARLLAAMNGHVKHALRQDQADSPSDDGMELGICRIEPGAARLTYAGARFALWVSNRDGVTEIKGNRSGIGYRRYHLNVPFDNQAVELAPDATLYLASDGATDQIGGERRLAFGRKRFRGLLDQVRARPLAEQRQIVLDELERYRGSESRRDDLTVFGFRPR